MVKRISVNEFLQKAVNLKPGEVLGFHVNEGNHAGFGFGVTCIYSIEAYCLVFNCYGGGMPFILDITEYDTSLDDETAAVVDWLGVSDGDVVEINATNQPETKTISDYTRDVHDNAKSHGWWDGEERSFGELIALCHSELSEALEEYRNGCSPTTTHYSGGTEVKLDGAYKIINQKPEGIPSELADCVIRIMDMCGHYGIDLEAAISEKHEYNKLRPYRHGGKAL